MSKFSLENTCIKKGSLDGEVAVVTGATSNVGLGYAQALAWAGAKVVIVGRNETRGNAAADTINADNGPDTAIFVKADVSSAEDMHNLKIKAVEKFGKVDILINNAMDLSLNGPILGSKIEDLDRSYAISARGVMLAVNEFVPGMIERGHGVVSYSTTQFHYLPPMIGGGIYTAGKAAATSAMMSLANEVKGKGVSVFCLAPAGVGQINPDSVDDPEAVAAAFKMPGFNGLIPIDAAGAGMVYSILRAEEIHGCGLLMSDALVAMDYPFPVPETVNRETMPYIGDMQLTMLLCYMGHGFPKK
ncbi:MAG: SDR family NAD(P)-dependent oxidoreductase [Oscillospiraceae bacterium]|nr:SDR family NAD(P)-dependent oxidoreductase [Oscillospiraceae bacterium]